ncbi:MAG: MarR family transcriptional regulator [Eubacteriales bacterium]|nr:MarR family transcriptional regulator [Eubacteriales bacterium]
MESGAKGYDPDEALKLDNQLCFPLYAAARKIVNAYTPLLRPLGITYTQYITFMVLWETDGVSVGEICRRLHLDSGTVTPLLKKMEKEGFVTRRRSPDDERRVSVFLTEKGIGLKKKAKDIPLQIGQCVHLSREDAETLYRILYLLLDQK